MLCTLLFDQLVEELTFDLDLNVYPQLVHLCWLPLKSILLELHHIRKLTFESPLHLVAVQLDAVDVPLVLGLQLHLTVSYLHRAIEVL